MGVGDAVVSADSVALVSLWEVPTLLITQIVQIFKKHGVKLKAFIWKLLKIF
jgi:hypothetical protein